MKKVFLHGFLADKVGGEWDLIVDSPVEAIRAINCNTDDQLLRNIHDNYHRNVDIVVWKINSHTRQRVDQVNSSGEYDEDLLKEILVESHEMEVCSDFEEIHFAPRVQGEVISATIGVIATAVGTAMASISLASMAFTMVAGMVVAGIAAAMFPPVKVTNNTKSTKSYMFGGRANLLEQGGAVPVGYGMLRVGSNTIGFFGQNRFLPGSLNNDTIESYTQFHVQDLICEGPIEGFCDSSGNVLNGKNTGGSDWDDNEFVKSIYINELPIKNESNELNFMPSEDQPIKIPKFSLGSSAHDSQFSGINSRIEYEPRASGSALPGPQFDIGGFYPEKVAASGGGETSRWGGAKSFTHPITDREVGMVTLALSSEGQYHNWTDQRVRRRWFSRRVKVDKGTDPVTLAVAVRIFDGKKFISPIICESGNLLEGIDGSSSDSLGVPATSKYYISGILNKSDIRKKVSYTSSRAQDMFRFYVYAIFSDTGDIDSADALEYGLGGLGLLRKDIIFFFLSNAKDLISEFYKLRLTSYISAGDANYPEIFTGDTGESYTMNKVFDLYFAQKMRKTTNGSLAQDSNEDPSRMAVLFAGVFAEISDGSYNPEALFKRFFHETMSIVKAAIIDDTLTLANSGKIYAIQEKVYYKPSDMVKKGSLTPAEKDSGLWTYVGPSELELMQFAVMRWFDSAAYIARNQYWMVLPTAKTISERKYKSLGSPALYQVWKASEKIKNQGMIYVKGLSTSPASIDYSFQLPYIGPGEAASIQLLRCTAEISSVDEMATTSKRLSLKAVRGHKCLAGELMRFDYPCTAWIKTFWDSVNFQQVPNRSYLAKLKKVATPDNYHAETRTYIGAWAGAWGKSGVNTNAEVSEKELVWTDNPAWILLDIMTNKRFGLGRYGMTMSDVDKWHLYSAARFCDELVETGLPLETPKRYFETNNFSTQNGDNLSYLGSRSRYLEDLRDGDSFFIRIFNSKQKDKLTRPSFLDEFNDSVPDRLATNGKFIAFFMSDGSVQRRKIKNVLGATAEGSVPSLSAEIEANAHYVEVYGPTFIDHNSTDSSKRTAGFCCIEKTYPLVEPRFSLNVYYNRQESALQTVKELVAQFRTVLNYIGGKVSFSTEKKGDPLLMFTDANVSKDGFAYAGSGKSTRVTAAKIRYLDKFDGFKPKVEYYEDPGGIDKFGYVESEVLALGCTSKGQAKRFAKFTVLAPTLETEMVSFTTGMEGALLLPGSVIEISDSRRFGENINGRIKSISPNDYAVKVDKLMSNLSFWDPETGLDSDRVELCILSPRGFEDPNKLDEVAESKSKLPSFTEADQLSLVSETRRSQMVYFDGFISENKREIKNLVKKEKFDVNKNSDVIIRSNHGLEDGDSLRFSSFGVLPQYRFVDGSGQDVVERLNESSIYYAVSSSNSFSSFKISKTKGGAPVDFVDQGFAMRKTFNSSVDIDAGAEISGGEHFYSRFRRVDGRDETKEALESMMVGSVWSIRGFKKDLFLRPESVSENVLSNFILNSLENGGLEAKQIKGKKYSYFSEHLGSFSFSGQATDTTKGTVLSFKQRGPSGSGLGAVLVNVDHFQSSRHIDLQNSLREVKLIDGNTIVVTDSNGAATTLFRSSLDTDIFRIIGGSSNNLYKIINDKKYLISSHDGHDYIRLASVKPSQSQLDEWISRLGTLSIPDTQPATAPPQDTIEISIDDFRNVGRRQYRISSVVESEYGQYDVNASEYNREKFSIIENEISLNRPTLPIPPQVSMEIPLPPKDFAVKDTTYRGVITNV